MKDLCQRQKNHNRKSQEIGRRQKRGDGLNCFPLEYQSSPRTQNPRSTRITYLVGKGVRGRVQGKECKCADTGEEQGAGYSQEC